MNSIEEKFEKGWYTLLSPFLKSKHFYNIGKQLKDEVRRGISITPVFDDTFRCFKECPYSNLKVVMLGLDPYPQANTADGLAFSAKNNYGKEPKSLDYIIRAMEKDVYDGFGIGYNQEYMNPDLTRWARQGVLLLNSALSTHVGKTGVHLNLWHPFIHYVFTMLAQYNTGIIFILLGANAKLWKPVINQKSNYILEASHPASASYRGLEEWDCNKVFSKTNSILESNQGFNEKILW